MTTDAANALRLKGMVDSILRNSSEDQRPAQAKSLSDAYKSLRVEARGIAEERGIVDEFDRMFQEMTTPPPNMHRLFEAASYATEASALLAKLSGWLEGLVEEARMTLEAHAYAEVRLRQERT